MRRGQDIAVQFPGLYLVHHNLPGKELEPHSHAEHLLFIPLRGEIEVKLRERSLTCGPGRMIYLPPKTEHAFHSSAHEGERLIALIEAAAWKKADIGSHPAGMVAASQLCKEVLFYLLLHPKARHATSLIQALIQTLGESLEASCHLLDLNHLESSARDERLKRAVLFLRDNLSESVSMEDVARHSGMSVRNLNRLFAVELGLTPKQVLAQYRVDKASEALLSGKVTVTEAAFQVGYSSLPQFISVFRQLTGQLPSEFARAGGNGRKPSVSGRN